MANTAANSTFQQAFELKRHTLSEAPTVRLWELAFDLPGEKVNKLSRAVMEELKTVVLPALKAQAAEIDVLVLVSRKPQNFIAGADIELFQTLKTEAEARELALSGHELFNAWEDLPFPTVAAIQGAALGGGCEWALASSAIVMSDDSGTKIGLPETMLGIIPGLGGCVRLPRKIGVAQALDLILTGKSLSASSASKLGLIEATLPKENFVDAALLWSARQLAALIKVRAGRQRLAREPKLGGVGGWVGSLLENNPAGRAVIYRQARQGVLKKTRGHYPAPLEAIAVLSDTGAQFGHKLSGQARARALAREAQGFGKMAMTPVSTQLVRLFFLTEKVKKDRGIAAQSSARARVATRIGVLGAGIMGGGIAQLAADRGLSVRMKDVTQQALALGVQAAWRLFDKSVKRRKLSRREALQKLNLIAPSLDFSGFRALDVVIEAIVEKLEIKQSVLKELEQHVSDDTVIASNTSSLSITQMQSVMLKPERFAGMHFFNPVHRMPLVEVIRGEKSNDTAVSSVFELSKRMGKTPIVVKDAPGFLVNRLLMPYLNEATLMLSEGAPIEELDRALLEFGMPMGPMELIDEVGIDVGDKVAKILFQAFGARMEPSPVNAKLVAAERLGKKNARGLYDYPAVGAGQKGQVSPQVYELIGVQPRARAIAAAEIVERCMLAMINEAARALDEQIVATPGEVDLGMIMGTGFPPFRGGLLRYADSLGTRQIVARLEHYRARGMARFEPAPRLKQMAERGAAFYA